ncbi:MAG: hypothetical protein WCD72_02810 [Dehalococcoidia bacterium]
MKKLTIIFPILIITSLLLATSCVTRQVPVVETYYETEYKTEYRTETYTETVNTVISSKEGASYLNLQTKWYTDVIIPGFEGSGGTYYYDYLIESSHSKNQVEINMSQGAQQQSGVVRVYDLSSTGPIPPRPTPFKKIWIQPSELDWLSNLSTTLSTARLLGEVQLGSGMGNQIVFDANGVTEFGILATTWDAYAIRSVRLVWTDEVIGPKIVTSEKQVPYQAPYQAEKQRTVYKTETVPFWDAIFGR